MPEKSNWTIRKKWLVTSGIIMIVFSMVFFLPSDKFNLPDTVDFNYDIRPILSNNCYSCHGPDSSSREAGLRLDIQEIATTQLESGKIAIIPNHSFESELIKRVSSQDPNLQMPPPELNKQLTQREIALLEKWIDQGAEWKPYWAFIPPSKPDLPQKQNKNSPSQIIDYLINEKLNEKRLQASDKAFKNDLIRRVAYLLTGLPPHSKEVKSYLSDHSDKAYENMVDQYLSSPHFGERWARHWMDLVRYGENMGHEFDFPISGAYHYRDYLIRAFNEDVPYDLFVKEHLAGDLIKTPRLHPTEKFNESIIGTGYFFLGEGKHSPVSLKGEELDRIDNMIDVTSKTFQALTVSCARCHDHKFDPIPTTDYYAMYGMIESSRITPLPSRWTANDEKIIKRLDAIQREIKVSIAEHLIPNLQKPTTENIKAQKLFISSINEKPNEEEVTSSHQKEDDDQIQIGDFRNGHWNGWYTNGVAFGKSPLIGKPIFDLNSYQINSLESGYASSRYYGSGIQGSLHSPNFEIKKDFIAVKARGNHSTIRIIVDNFQIIRAPLWGGLEKKINNPEWKTYFFDVSMLKGHKAYLQFLPGYFSNHAYKIDSENFIEIQYAIAYDDDFSEPKIKYNIKNEDTVSVVSKWVKGENHPKEVDLIRKKVARKRIYNNKIVSLNVEYDSLYSQLYNPSHFMGVVDGDAVFSSVFFRGDFNKLSKEKVSRQFLSAIQKENSSSTQHGSGRLAWAESVIDPSNPLTSRVMVNRVWHHLFGRGIVETVDNFGLQGKLPTHPELLDYLSVYFMEESWSVKNLIKQILMTETFQRSTLSLTSNLSNDPNNYFLHHFPIRRLEAEAIRDGMLAVSGSLDSIMFGKSVPIYLTNFMTGRGRPSESGPLDGNGRRSIYLEVRRNFLSPMMSVFDTPVPFSTFGKRNTTNVPAQSLTLMNDPFVHDQAKKWAERILNNSDSEFDQRIQQVYLRAFSRMPTEEEILQARETMDNFAIQYEGSYDELKDDIRLWTDYCHTIFNLKEFIHLL